MNLGAWIKGHKPAAAIAGVAGVGGLALYMRARSKRSGGAGSSMGVSASPSPGLTGSSGFDSSAMDTYNALASAISNQNDQISKIQSELTTGAVAGIPASSGSGLPPPPPGYALLPNPSAGQQALSAGQQPYVQVAPGVVLPVGNQPGQVSWGTLTPGEAQYVKIPG